MDDGDLTPALVLLAVPFVLALGYLAVEVYREWRFQCGRARLVKYLADERLSSLLTRFEREQPIDVRPALRRDRESR